MSSFQVELLESACVRYLLSLTLPARQLAQLSLLLSRLTRTDALHQTLQRLVQLPWMEDFVSVLPIVLQHLFSGSPSSYASQLETLNEMLHSPTCGAFSELQVSLFGCCTLLKRRCTRQALMSMLINIGFLSRFLCQPAANSKVLHSDKRHRVVIHFLRNLCMYV